MITDTYDRWLEVLTTMTEEDLIRFEKSIRSRECTKNINEKMRQIFSSNLPELEETKIEKEPASLDWANRKGSFEQMMQSLKGQ